jgi:putative serine protease PepD
MNEFGPHHEREDTQPVPAGAPARQTHRYGESGVGREDTAVHDTRAWAPAPGDAAGSTFFGTPAPQASPSGSRPDRTSRGGGFTAGILAAALVVGGVAGVGGAIGYDVLISDQATTGQSAPTVVQSEDSPAQAGSVEAVAGSVLPSVVKINVEGAQGASGSGSGVVLNKEGEILTNYHVVEAAEGGGNVSVGFNDGTTAAASVIGTDPLTDLAIIQAEGVSGLKPATLGQSSSLDVGQEVVAIGSPFGLQSTVTSGIVSALNRPVSVGGDGSALATTYPAIQTDAAINPGNSGGPLVNMRGEVVGINSSIRTASSSLEGPGGSIGLGFAIPIDQTLPIVEQLRAGQPPTHARLGVTVTDASGDNGMTGAGIARVEGGSAADEAGLRRGDVVVKVDDVPVQDASSLVATVRGHRPGDTVNLTVVRGGERVQVEASLDSDEGAPAP